MNLIERFFGKQIPVERLIKQSDVLWAYPLTYSISVKIFTEHLRLFDLFEKTGTVSKSWRWMVSQRDVMSLAFQNLGLTIPPQVHPRDYFRSL